MKDPFSDLDVAAFSQHELFESYIRAGFARHEALELIKTFVAEQLKFYLWTGRLDQSQDEFNENPEAD
jgi:hypothetical protein